MLRKILIGQDIGKKLIDGLGLPKHTVSFELRCAVNEPVTVRCEYLQEGEEFLVPLINDYQLIAVGGTIRPKAEPVHFDVQLKVRIDAAHAALIKRYAELSKMDERLFCHGKH